MAPKNSAQKELARFDRNYAEDSETADRFYQEVYPCISDTRGNRLRTDEVWLNDLRKWSCRLDFNQGYQGRSAVFVPELNNQVEVSIERKLTALFPNTNYIHCVPLKDTTEENAEKIQAAVKYELDDRNKLPALHDQFERNNVLFGSSVYKQSFEEKFVEMYVRDKNGKPKKQMIPKWHGTKIRVVDPFRFYVYPELNSLDEAHIIFEDMMVAIDDAEDSGLYYGLDRIQALQFDLNHQWVDSTKMEIMRLATAIQNYRKSALFTEVWMDFRLTKNGPKVPVQGVIANNSQVVLLRRNPYWFQHHPYVGSRYVVRPGNPYYGLSLPDKMRTQQDMLNDVTNQTMDSITYSLAPIMIIDPALAGDVNSMKLMPGARWLGSPEGIKPITFPDVSGAGLEIIQELRGQFAQFSDNTPGIAPQLQGKSRSATQASIVAAAVGARQRVMAQREEQEVFAPLCKNTHMLLQQFMEEEYQIKIQGPDMGSWIAMNIAPEDLAGDVDWVWKGTSYQETTAVRTQQLMSFLQLALQTAQLLPQGEIDIPALVKRIAKDAFDMEDMDQFFKSLSSKKTVDPDLENIAMKEGQDVNINPGDDDKVHIATHLELFDDKKLDADDKIKVAQHISLHRAQQQAKDAVVQLQARQQALQGAIQSQGGPAPGDAASGAGEGDGRSGPQVPSPMEGNLGQQASSPDRIFSAIQPAPGSGGGI